MNFVSELYVGGISDVELTRECGIIQKLNGKQNISVMADQGFTIRDQLSDIGVELIYLRLWKDGLNFQVMKCFSTHTRGESDRQDKELFNFEGHPTP